MESKQHEKINPACEACDNYIGNNPKNNSKELCKGDWKSSFYYPDDCPGWENEEYSQQQLEWELEAENQIFNDILKIRKQKSYFIGRRRKDERRD